PPHGRCRLPPPPDTAVVRERRHLAESCLPRRAVTRILKVDDTFQPAWLDISTRRLDPKRTLRDRSRSTGENENRCRFEHLAESFSTECPSLSTTLAVTGQIEVMRCFTARTWVPRKAGRG